MKLKYTIIIGLVLIVTSNLYAQSCVGSIYSRNNAKYAENVPQRLQNPNTTTSKADTGKTGIRSKRSIGNSNGPTFYSTYQITKKKNTPKKNVEESKVARLAQISKMQIHKPKKRSAATIRKYQLRLARIKAGTEKYDGAGSMVIIPWKGRK